MIPHVSKSTWNLEEFIEAANMKQYRGKTSNMPHMAKITPQTTKGVKIYREVQQKKFPFPTAWDVTRAATI